MQSCRNVIVLAGFGLLIPIVPVDAAAKSSPFVAAFERFARHGEIEKLQAGRVLLTELSCTACHSTGDSRLEPKRGPRLTGAGNRLQNDWIKQFLASPQDAKPGSTMPDLFASWPDAEKSRAIESLAAFLQTQLQEFPDING
jgi:cbb3-type cytochrome oxidase cytochrome c subunit